MLLRLEDIPAEGLDLDAQLDPVSLSIEGVSSEGPVRGTFHVERMGGLVLVKGRVGGSLRLNCSRCLEDVILPLQEDVFVEFQPLASGGREQGKEKELSEGDLDVEFYQGDTLDMTAFLEAQVRLALPMKALCSEDCPGLCPRCGQSRRIGCSCPEEAGGDMWDALRNLLQK